MGLDINDATISRQYDLRDGRKIILYVWPPLIQPGGEYACFYRLVGLLGDRTRKAYGIDSLQALLLAIRVIYAELSYCEAYKNGDLTWLGGRDLGLPLPVQFSDIVQNR